MEFYDDFFQDVCLWFLTYDNEKLNDAHTNNHMNALITRMVQNNVFSNNSPYYGKYKRFRDRTQEITYNELQFTDEYDGLKGKSYETNSLGED